MKEIYLDNSATTMTAGPVADLMAGMMTQDYGNPSSLHQKGVEAEKHIKEAKDIFSGILNCKEKEIFFTSGGTESDNWSVFSSVKGGRKRKKRIITTAIEHPAVSEPVRELEKEGFEVIFLPVDEYGIVSLEALEDAVDDDTALVSVMMVNNEVGSLQPVKQAADIVHKKSPDAFFHVDAVQAFGKYRIDTRAMGIDLLSVSAHKLHGPKGAGLLYISDRIKLPPMIYGGGQQKALRSGTENVPGIAGFALAAKMAYEDLDKDVERITGLRDRMTGALSGFEGVKINGPAADDPQNAAPHIVNASFTGVRSEVLLHSLEDKGIYVSAGSACSSHKRTPSATLKAMGLSKERMESAVRFSFSRYTTEEEIDKTLDAIGELLPMLRRFTRR